MDIIILPEDFDKDFDQREALYSDHFYQFEDPSDCPLARAIKRQLGVKREYVAVRNEVVYINTMPYSYMGNYFTNEKALAIFVSKQPYTQHLQEENI